MNKLIILLVLTGKYQGGAQLRYLNLFKELQKKRDDYFLLLNKSLYDACIRDGILTSTKNIIVTPIKYEQFDDQEENILNDINSGKKTKKKNSLFRIFLGRRKSFIKQFTSWLIFNISLLKIIKQYKIKSVYGIFTGGMWSWPLLRLLRINLIYSYNDSGAALVSKKFLDFFSSEFFALRNSNKVDFLSEGLVNILQQKNVKIDPKKILITPNSFINYERFYPENPKQKVISFSARMTKIKNPELLLDAINILNKKQTSTYKFFFIGDGILLPTLKEKASKLQLKNTEFVGSIGSPENIIRSSSIFISIQEDNNYPSQSLIEAMACENSIIASDVGETRKIVSEKEGILVNLDANEIAEAISLLINNPNLCKTMGANARKKVLNEHNLDKFINYFTLILD